MLQYSKIKNYESLSYPEKRIQEMSLEPIKVKSVLPLSQSYTKIRYLFAIFLSLFLVLLLTARVTKKPIIQVIKTPFVGIKRFIQNKSTFNRAQPSANVVAQVRNLHLSNQGV